MMEYILIAEVNSSDECAHRLGRLLADCKALVMLNIIPYNPTATRQEWMFVFFLNWNREHSKNEEDVDIKACMMEKWGCISIH